MSQIVWKKIASASEEFYNAQIEIDEKWQEVNNREEEYENELLDKGLLIVNSEFDNETNNSIRTYTFVDSTTFARFMKFIYENKPTEYIEDYANLKKIHNYTDKHEFIFS